MSMRDTIEMFVHGVVDRVYLWRDRRSLGETSDADGLQRNTPNAPQPPIEWKKVGVMTGSRTWIERKPTATAIVCLGVLGICFLLYKGLTRFAGGDAYVYYVDMGTGQTFTAHASNLPPISAPSGSKLSDGQAGGVRAHVYACGGCTDTPKQFVGFLERLGPKYREAAVTGSTPSDGIHGFTDLDTFIASGWLVASPASPQVWVAKDSPAGAKIMDEPFERCEAEPKPEDRSTFECQPR